MGTSDHAGARLVLLAGVPGAGKSTACAAMGDVVACGRDRIRTELFGAGYHRGAPDPAREPLVTAAQLEAVRTALAEGRVAVVDDTNIDPAHRQLWVDQACAWGVPCEVRVVDVPLEVALQRNARRQRVVPPLVVVAMWMSGVEQGLLLPGL